MAVNKANANVAHHQGRPGPLDIAGAAEYLGTSSKFIRRRIADGTLRAYRLKGSRLIRIDQADIESLKQPVTEC